MHTDEHFFPLLPSNDPETHRPLPPGKIPWEMIKPHDAQAQKNHCGQTLLRLAERGGLGLCEAVAVLEGRRWQPMSPLAASARLVQLVDEFHGRRNSKEAVLETFLTVLREAYAADPEATAALILTRVPCNLKLADHPTIQVGAAGLKEDSKGLVANDFEVGALGLINGICEALMGKRIAAIMSDSPREGVEPKLMGFKEYQPNE